MYQPRRHLSQMHTSNYTAPLMLLHGCRQNHAGGLLISVSQTFEAIGGYTTKSVTHGQYDAWPPVTFPAAEHRCHCGAGGPMLCWSGVGKAGSGGSTDPLKFGAEVTNCIWRLTGVKVMAMTTCLTLIHESPRTCIHIFNLIKIIWSIVSSATSWVKSTHLVTL